MTELLADDPEIATPKNRWRGCGCTGASCLALLIVIGLLLPMRRTASEAARRTGCGFNLRGIAQALQVYAKEHGSLPPAYTKDAQGRPLHSWRTLILPYMEEKQLFDTIDLTKPWDDPVEEEFIRMGTAPSYVSPHVGGITMAAFADTHIATLFLGDVDSLPTEIRRAMLTTAADAPAFSE